MKFEILPEDFDNAIKQPWSPRTCLIAQACIRMGIDTPESMCITLPDGHLLFESRSNGEVTNAMLEFDSYFGQGGATGQEPALRALRASLPISVEL